VVPAIGVVVNGVEGGVNSNGAVNVAVVIPCYCCVETIERALRSVAQQSMLPMEIVLVEDASPDNGATLRCLKQLLHSFSHACDAPMRLICLLDNMGPSGARNAAWETVTADYIAFLDADDAWHPKKLEIQFQWMKAHPEVTLSGHKSCEVDSSMTPSIVVDAQCFARRCDLHPMLFKNPLATRTVMVRRDISLRFVGDKRYAEDYLLWLQIVASGLQVYVLDRVLAYSFKPAFGASGLSANFLAMEMGVQDDFCRLRKAGAISFSMFCVASMFSLLKYLRRLLVSSIRSIHPLKPLKLDEKN